MPLNVLRYSFETRLEAGLQGDMKMRTAIPAAYLGLSARAKKLWNALVDNLEQAKITYPITVGQIITDCDVKLYVIPYKSRREDER